MHGRAREEGVKQTFLREKGRATQKEVLTAETCLKVAGQAEARTCTFSDQRSGSGMPAAPVRLLPPVVRVLE